MKSILLKNREATINLHDHVAKEEEGSGGSGGSGGESKKDTKVEEGSTAADSEKAIPMEIDDDDDELAAALAMSKNEGEGGAAATADKKSPGYGLPTNFQGNYEMFAIVTHIGRSANSGHYMGWVKREVGGDDWLRFNDKEVDECKFVDIKDLDGGTGDNDMVYLALYRQIK